MSKRGKTLHSSTREIIFHVINFCQREKAAKHPIIDPDKITARVAAMCGLNKNTVTEIKKEGHINNGIWCTPGKKGRGRPKKIILDDFALLKTEESHSHSQAMELGRTCSVSLETMCVDLKLQTCRVGRKTYQFRLPLNHKNAEKDSSNYSITAEHWRKECDHVIHLEQKYCEQDHLKEDMQEVIINATDSSTSSSEEDNSLDLFGSSDDSPNKSGIEYLESDFDYGSDQSANE